MEQPNLYPPPVSDFMDGRQERIYKRLYTRIGEGSAIFYREACQLRSMKQAFATTAHLVAHLFREIESALRAVTLPDTYQPSEECPDCRSKQGEQCPTCGSWFEKSSHQKAIIAIADAYELDKSTRKQWLGLSGKLHGYAHRNSLTHPRPYAEYKAFYESVDATFDSILAFLERKSSRVFLKGNRPL